MHSSTDNCDNAQHKDCHRLPDFLSDYFSKVNSNSKLTNLGNAISSTTKIREKLQILHFFKEKTANQNIVLLVNLAFR